MNKPLKNQTAIVTGASKGIGAQIAINLAKAGADLIIIARNEMNLNKVKSIIEAQNQKCLSLVCDVSQNIDLNNVLDLSLTKTNRIDILVNNAGIYATESIFDFSIDTWNKVINTNLTHCMLTIAKLAPQMKVQNYGRIINISSISGTNGEIYSCAYSAAKAGMIGMTKTLAQELARYNITINCVSPGWVDNEMALKQMNDPYWCELNNVKVQDSAEIARLAIPSQRLIKETEIASLVNFLVSKEAKSITGQNINICGGLSLV